MDPYQRFLSCLKLAGPTLTFFLKQEKPLLFLPYSFFEPGVLVPFLIILFLLVFGSMGKGKTFLYIGSIWFFLTLFPLIDQPTFGKITFREPPYTPLIGLFLIVFSFIQKFFR